MTGNEFIYEFKLGYDIFATAAMPGFTNTQALAILNRAYDDVIDLLYDNKQFENLGRLLVNTETSSGTDFVTIENYGTCKLPTDLWRMVSVKANFTKVSTPANTGIMKVRSGASYSICDYVNPDEFEKFQDYTLTDLNNEKVYFKKPIYTTVDMEIGGLKYPAIKIRGDYYVSSFSSIYFTYVKKRAAIVAGTSVTCDLSEHVHRQVVSKAVDIAKQIINVQEPQSK